MRTLMNRFGLARLPFSKDIATEDLFEVHGHLDADARLFAATKGRASARADRGSEGREDLCPARFGAGLNPSRYRVTYLHHSNISPHDLFRQLSTVLGLEPEAFPSAIFCQVQARIEELGRRAEGPHTRHDRRGTSPPRQLR